MELNNNSTELGRENDELIWKQDAIDAIACAGKIGKLSCIDIIKRMPSAQPEIIRCKDCCHYPGEYTDCPLIGWHRNGDDFCSFAERRSDGSD